MNRMSFNTYVTLPNAYRKITHEEICIEATRDEPDGEARYTTRKNTREELYLCHVFCELASFEDLLTKLVKINASVVLASQCQV